jgi:hypothetical protein
MRKGAWRGFFRGRTVFFFLWGLHREWFLFSGVVTSDKGLLNIMKFYITNTLTTSISLVGRHFDNQTLLSIRETRIRKVSKFTIPHLYKSQLQALKLLYKSPFG